MKKIFFLLKSLILWVVLLKERKLEQSNDVGYIGVHFFQMCFLKYLVKHFWYVIILTRQNLWNLIPCLKTLNYPNYRM